MLLAYAGFIRHY